MGEELAPFIEEEKKKSKKFLTADEFKYKLQMKFQINKKKMIIPNKK